MKQVREWHNSPDKKVREPPTDTNAEWHRQKMLWEFREGRGQQSIREDFLEEVRLLLTWKDGAVWRYKPKAAEQARKHQTAVKPFGLKLRLCVKDGHVKDLVMERPECTALESGFLLEGRAPHRKSHSLVILPQGSDQRRFPVCSSHLLFCLWQGMGVWDPDKGVPTFPPCSPVLLRRAPSL